VLLVVAQLSVRAWIAAGDGFYWDDLILTGRAATYPLFSAEFLLYDHDGHLMPGAFFVAGVLTWMAPLEWWGPAASLVLFQTLASLAVFRLLRLLIGDRLLLLVPLALYLFSAVSLPTFAWWASALNAMPLQIGLAWVAGDAVLLYRTRRARYAMTGTLVFALCLTFFSKVVLVPWFAFLVVALAARNTGDPTPIRSTLRRGSSLWIGAILVTSGWTWAYLALVDAPVKESTPTVAEALALAGRGVAEGLLPALTGGPWSWGGAQTLAVWAEAPLFLVAVSCALWLAVVAVTCVRRRGAPVVWLLVAGHAAVSAGLMVLGRYHEDIADELPRMLRHFADSSVVVAVALALVLTAPLRERRETQPWLTPRGRRILLPAAAALFVVSSLWSTVTFTGTWQDKLPEDYLRTARGSLAEAANVPLLDQEVPGEVLWAVSYPNNLASQIFAPLDERPDFTTVAPSLRVLDDSGRVVDAVIEPRQALEAGPVPECGWAVSGEGVVHARLRGPLMSWGWTVRLDYYASRFGVLHVSLSTGEAVRMHVARGMHTAYLRLDGGGEDLRLHAASDDLSVCITDGEAGLVVPAGAQD
jgi:hypothetical protein